MPRPRLTPKRFVAQPAAITQWPGYVMKYVFEAWYASYERDVAELGLTVNGLVVLVVIDQEGPQSPSRLAEWIGIDRSLMVSIVDELESKGLLERKRSEADRRRFPLHITEAGAKLAEQARAVTDTSTDQMLSVMTAEERQRFEQLLRLLPDAVQKLHPAQN